MKTGGVSPNEARKTVRGPWVVFEGGDSGGVGSGWGGVGVQWGAVG
jgi:hypothetical protein